MSDVPSIETYQDGRRRAFRNGLVVCNEDEGEIVFQYLMVREIRQRGIRTGSSVAHIGLGFGVVAWMLGPEFIHVAFEIDPLDHKHLPPYVSIFNGDYRTEIYGSFDVIVAYMDKPAESKVLVPHLSPGGLLIGWLDSDVPPIKPSIVVADK